MNDRPTPGRRARGSADYEGTVPPARGADRAGAMPPAQWRTPRWLPLALGVVVGLALVMVAVGLFSHRSEASSPSAAPLARQICDDLTTQRYGDLYGLLTSDEQAVGTRDQFTASQQQLDAQLGTARTCAYTVSGQDASSATLTVTLARGTSAASQGQVRLTLEGNVWRISDYDSSLVAIPSHAA